MKTTKKTLVIAVMILMASSISFAQSVPQNQALKEYMQPPKSTEIVVGFATQEKDGGQYGWDSWDGKEFHYEKYFTIEQALKSLMECASKDYGETYPKYELRNFQYRIDTIVDKSSTIYWYKYTYRFSASVVISDPKLEANENLSNAIDKAFRNVRQGSRIAIDQITVWEEIDRDDYKDRLIDVLLDKGYKVVAKEYLEKLYEEQLNQQSGIYNDRTTVQENNFSAVGYYINVKVTKTSLRVQVVNVSTGEYEGNATINF